MRLPQLVDYRDAMVAPSVSLIDPVLRLGTPRRNPLGLPSPISGGFALTFEVRVGDDRYAVRCFHKDRTHLRERYARIAEFVRAGRLPFLVEVDYLADGIRVGGGVFPVVRMRWVDGARLDDWIEDHRHDAAALGRVRRGIADAVAALRGHDAAHGDLQHGNVLVLPDGSIRLVDYDGMYLPGLREYGSSEEGNRNYQHPERGRQYDPSLDLFSAAVIDLTLRAVEHDPTLWPRFNEGSGERLLFSADDLADPSASELFDRLALVPELAEPTRRLRTACLVPVGDVPAALSGALTVATRATDRRTRRAAVPAAPGVLAAMDRRTLLARQGDQVTVVGRVVTVRRTPAATVIDFGDHRTGALTVVAWDTVGRDLARLHGDPRDLREKWVEVTGLLTVQHNGSLGVDAPQIELRSARSVTRLSVFEARRRLTEPAGRPAAASRAGERTPGRDDLDGRLGRLYSSPTFTSRLAASTGPQPSPAPAPAGPVVPPAGAGRTARTARAGSAARAVPVVGAGRAVPVVGGGGAAGAGAAGPSAPVGPGPQGSPVPQGSSVPRGQEPRRWSSGRGVGGQQVSGRWSVGWWATGWRALVLAVCVPPVGLVLAVLVLADHVSYPERDRAGAAVALSLSLLTALLVAMLSA